MSTSYTLSETATFTATHAKHMAAKVATDLKRIQRLYGSPGEIDIDRYEQEAIAFLKAGYLGTVTYGFWKNGNWIEPTIRYTARELAGGSANDDDPGRIRPGKDISNATFYSYLTYSASWNAASESEKENFRRTLPFQRSGAPEPGISGYFNQDQTYSSGGRAIDRSSVRGF